MATPLLEARHLDKSYGGVRALADVRLALEAGVVHGLCGENGAGKSTLIRILSGALAPDGGELLWQGRGLGRLTVVRAERAGIAVIHQESLAFPDLGAAENIFVGREPRRARIWLDRAKMRREAGELLARLGEHLDLDRPVGTFSLAARQTVAIARALARSCRLLILDEPTASLSARECEALFQIVRQLRSEGVAILYVSHRLEELFALTQRISVLRDGGLVASCETASIDQAALVSLMVGREISAPLRTARPAPAASAHAPVRLDVRSLTRWGAFHDVSFTVRSGEIVALAGLVGAGRSEVARAIVGVDRPDSGIVQVDGVALETGSVARALARGVAYVPEDRQHEGLVLDFSVEANLSLGVLEAVSRQGWIVAPRERALALRLIEMLSIKTPRPSSRTRTLSGGNQQKVALARWLAAAPRVLVLDEPTRGVDVGSKAEIHRTIRELAGQGLAVLLISSDLPEVLSLADRVLVMREGRLSGELAIDQATQEVVLFLAMPQSASTMP